MTGLAARCTQIIDLIDHALRPTKHIPTAGVDPLDARSRWTQQGPMIAQPPARPYDEMAFPITEAVTGADYWRARCELAEEDADRLYTFTLPDHSHISPAVVEWVRQQHVDAVHYRTAARDRLVPQ